VEFLLQYSIFARRQKNLRETLAAMPDEVYDKHGKPIHEGDNVYTPYRGGRHEGIASEIVTTRAEAEEAGVKNPPKVCYHIPGLEACRKKSSPAHIFVRYIGAIHRSEWNGCRPQAWHFGGPQRQGEAIRSGQPRVGESENGDITIYRNDINLS
jgi:hypothetical protein